MGRRRRELPARLRAGAIWRGDCLIWTGCVNERGYGLISVRSRTTRVHRLAYELEWGAIPKGLVIDHSCFQRRCINVTHLRAVTPRQNNQNRRGAQKNSSTGVRGVSWDKSRGKYIAGVKHKGVRYNLGRFDSIKEAEMKVIAKRKELGFLGDAPAA